MTELFPYILIVGRVVSLLISHGSAYGCQLLNHVPSYFYCTIQLIKNEKFPTTDWYNTLKKHRFVGFFPRTGLQNHIAFFRNE